MIKNIMKPILIGALSCVLGLTPLSVAQAAPYGAGLHWQPLGEPGSGGAMTALSISPYDSRRLLVAGDMLGDGLSLDGGDSWQGTFGFKSWEMADFSWHPTNSNIVWNGSMNGPYLSTDGGQHWEQKRNGFPPVAGFGYSAPVEKVLFDPLNSNHLLAIGGSSRHWEAGGKPLWGAVWESHDSGNNWSRLTTITKDGSSVAPDAAGENITWADYAPGDPHTLYATADKAGFLVSIDGGKTWTRRINGLPSPAVGRVAVHPTNKNIIWIAVDNYVPEGTQARKPGGVYKTTDGGLNWVNSSNGLGQVSGNNDYNQTSHYFALAVAPSHPQTLYANDAAWNTGVIYRSDDGGASWRAIATKHNEGTDNNDPVRRKIAQVKTAYPAGLSLTRLLVDPKNPNLVYGFNSEFIIRTRDGGQTWDDATAIPVTGTDAWRGRGYSGLVCTNFRFDPQTPNRAILEGMDAGKLWLSNDNLKTWTRKLNDPWPWGGGVDVSFAGSHIYATCGQFGQFLGVARSVDGGATWQMLGGKARSLPELMAGGNQPAGIYAQSDAPNRVWVCIENKLYHSEDGGDTWKLMTVGLEPHWFAGDPSHPRHFFLSGSKNVYETNDGVAFTPIGGPHQAGKMTVDSLGRLYVGADQGQRGGLWRYDGKSWTRLLDEYWITNVAVDPTNPQRLAITTNQNPYVESSQATGVWVSADGGATWSQQNDGLAMLRGFSLTFNPHNPAQLVWGSDGRGFWTTTWPRDFAPVGNRTYTATADDARFAAVDTTPPPAPPKPVVAQLRNGSMTEGGVVPTGWEGKFGTAPTARDTTIFKQGPASFRVEVAGTSGQGFQTLQAAGGSSYRITGWVKTQGNAKVNVAAQSFDAGFTQNNFDQIKYLQGDNDWTEFSKEIKLPDWATQFNLLLLVEGTGKAWLDEVQVTPVASPGG